MWRIPGLGGDVMAKLGASPVSLPGGQIYENLVSGAIEATEWVGPWNDYAMKFYEAAKYYYYPGFHEPGAGLSIGMNREVFESLNAQQQKIVEMLERQTTSPHAYGNATLCYYSAETKPDDQPFGPMRVTGDAADVLELVNEGVSSISSHSSRILASLPWLRSTATSALPGASRRKLVATCDAFEPGQLQQSSTRSPGRAPSTCATVSDGAAAVHITDAPAGDEQRVRRVVEGRVCRHRAAKLQRAELAATHRQHRQADKH